MNARTDTRRRGPARAAIGLALALLLAACGGGGGDRPADGAGDAGEPGTAAANPATDTEANPATATDAGDGPPFADRTAELGIDFVHFNGMTGELYFAEMTGAGGGFLDYDNDGDLDIYLRQGRLLGDGKRAEDAYFPYRGPLGGHGLPTDRLYRNRLAETGELAFVDVTAESGLAAIYTGYAMGLAAGDIDNDGDVDLYLTNFGPNLLLENSGDGTFRRLSAAAAGVADDRWSTAASFADFDGDGLLDLYVGNYVDFTLRNHKQCFAASSAVDYCGPLSYNPYPDRLLRNRGDGTFEDISARSQVATDYGATLGSLAADFDGDGRLDLYVANDGTANQLWLNRGDGRFADSALLAGVAFNREGQAEGSMGVDTGDVDSDGDQDLFMTHIKGETNTLYLRLSGSEALFEDRTREAGLAGPSAPMTGFGTAFFDLDNDGLLDLAVANGEVRVIPERAAAGDRYPLDQPNQLFRNLGSPGQPDFSNLGAAAGEPFAVAEVSRALAVGDVDDDGDADLLVTNNSGPARLLINRWGQEKRWLGLRLLSRAGEGWRDAPGTEATALLSDGRRLVRRVRTDGSYLACHDPRVLFGLGPADARGATVEAVEVRWPDGRGERFQLPAGSEGRYLTLRRGEGEAL